MLTQEIEIELCDFIVAVANSERELEIYRKLLSEGDNFEPYNAFLRLTKHQEDYISTFDFLDFLL